MYTVTHHEEANNIASSRRSVSQGAVQKTAREKIKKGRRRAFFFARCFLHCALAN